jgi:CheY-like chemotaxis protein
MTSQAIPKPVILCIDDEALNTFTRKLVLESAGYSVLVAQSGQEGLTILKSEPVDAVIVDYLMPEMNGGQVAEQIRSIRPGIPILMLSGCLEIPASVVAIVDACISKAEPQSRYSVTSSLYCIPGQLRCSREALISPLLSATLFPNVLQRFFQVHRQINLVGGDVNRLI